MASGSQHRTSQLRFRWRAKTPVREPRQCVSRAGPLGVCTSTGPALPAVSLHAVLRLGPYDRVRVAAKSNSTTARIEEQSNQGNEPSQDRLVVGSKRARQIAHRAKVGLDRAALAFYNGFRGLKVLPLL
jgi:hypothetical protein